MKKVLLLLIAALPLLLHAQQKPKGFYTSVLSKYNYRGWEIRKGDRLALEGRDTLEVKQIQKYTEDWGWAYYITGKNKAGDKVYYPIAQSVQQGLLKPPAGIDLSIPGTVAYGYLPVENNQVVYEHTGTVPGVSAASLYDNALSSLVRSYPQQILSIQDKEAGHLMIPVSYNLSYGSFFALNGWKEVEVSYLCDIRVKDGVYRIRLEGFRLMLHSVNHKWDSYALSLGEISNSRSDRNTDLVKAFHGQNQALISSLSQAIETIDPFTTTLSQSETGN